MVSIFLLLVLAVCAPTVSAQIPTSKEYPGWDVRYGIVPGTDLKALINKPVLITMTVETYKHPGSGESRMNGFGEAHGVYEIPLEDVSKVLFDFPGQRAYSPSLLEVRVLESSPNRSVVYQDIGVSFLGIKIGSKVTSEILRERLPDGALGIRARMVDNPSGDMFESYSSWYLKEVVVDGRKLLYIRNFTRPGMRNPAIGVQAAVKGFTPGELRSQIENTVKEARRRVALK